MSAEVPFIVKYLRCIEDETRVYAITSDEAKTKVEMKPSVIKVISVEWEEQ